MQGLPRPGGSRHSPVWDQTLPTLVHGYPEGLSRPVRNSHTIPWVASPETQPKQVARKTLPGSLGTRLTGPFLTSAWYVQKLNQHMKLEKWALNVHMKS
jgi:hypothetical protein